MREEYAKRQQPAPAAMPFLDAVTNAQFERRRALARGDVQAATHWMEEVDVLVAMGPSGFAVLRAGTEPTTFMAEATEKAEAEVPALTINFDAEGRPWVWAPDGWTDTRILGVLRQCVHNYEDTSEDHL